LRKEKVYGRTWVFWQGRRRHGKAQGRGKKLGLNEKSVPFRKKLKGGRTAEKEREVCRSGNLTVRERREGE